MKTENTILTIAAELKRYLEKRPNAADTLEGVVHWWLTQQRIEEQTGLVKQALELLAREGFITMRTNANGETVFVSAIKRHDLTGK